MTKVFRDENFYRFYDRGDRLCIEDMSFERCTFDHCSLSLTQDINRISTIRRVDLTNCMMIGCQTGPMVLSEVTVSGLKTDDLLIFWCPYFDRVSLSGEIGNMKVNEAAHPYTLGNARQKPFDDFRSEFYRGIDWALDISQARFKEFDIRGVPGRLIRRDPNSQILITRARAREIAKPGWERQLDPSNTLWPFMVRLFLGDGDEDTVFVAPLGAAKSKRDKLLRGLKELRQIGLAEPD
jgi:hypothetical protein